MGLRLARRFLFGLSLILCPLWSSALAQETAGEQAAIPPGTKITMQNWQQYKQFMPDGMIPLFEGKYFWKMPADLEMDVGPTVNRPLPTGYATATEKYGNQTQVVVLPDGRFDIKNYVAGLPFPNPAEPYKGWKLLANEWFGIPGTRIQASTPETGFSWGCVQDHFHYINCGKNMNVYHRLAFISHPGHAQTEPGAGGAYLSEFIMIWEPEHFKYLTDLTIFYQDIKHEEENYIFVPAFRRTLRVSTMARCSPLFGGDYTKDDARGGFNGNISIFQSQFLRDQKILALSDLTTAPGVFPENWDMPLGWAKPSWGPWTVHDVWVIDVRRIPLYTQGYCYGKRIMYLDKRLAKDWWEDLYDSNMKLWKVLSFETGYRFSPSANGEVPARFAVHMLDLQNDHETFGGSADRDGRDRIIDDEVPKQYEDIPRYASPAGLSQIMR
jgi:uncharacterized protein DUF1329